MKIKPLQYAQILSTVILSDSEGSHHLKEIAKKFWHLLQKNKQYKDLSKILEELEIESAKKNGKIIAKVYSEKPLTASEIDEIKNKLTKKPLNTEYLIHNTVKMDTTGIIVKVEDKIIDLTAEDKINQLKQKLS
ncbi:MAG: F0F1 ATP synthase subunit delta [Candidatus Berkelbacteria bacterium]|nr:F0F1 ATP synthase subunit delta [Candidatus Berkelbacteria bacterium]